MSMLNANPRGHEHKMLGGDSRSVKCMGGPWSLGFMHTCSSIHNFFFPHRGEFFFWSMGGGEEGTIRKNLVRQLWVRT